MEAAYPVWKRHFREIAIATSIVTVFVYLLTEVAGLIVKNDIMLDNIIEKILILFGLILVIAAIGSIANLGILNLIISELDGNSHKDDIGSIIRNGLIRLPKFLIVSLLSSLYILLFTILLFIPGIYKAVKLSFVDCSVASRDYGIIDSIENSEVLVENNWWRVFGFLLLTGFSQLIIQSLFTLPLINIYDSIVMKVIAGIFTQIVFSFFIVARACYYVELEREYLAQFGVREQGEGEVMNNE
jgi:hypothetical protein